MTYTTDGPTMPNAVIPPASTPPPGRPETWAIPPPGPRPPRPRGLRLGAAAVALAALACGALVASNYWAPANEFQPVGYVGENPFTAPVGTDQPGLVSVPAGGDRSGDSAEMYLQDPDRPACDGAALLEHLRADPAKAAAWAQVQRIGPAQLPAYMQGLTPVLLRAATAVVDHGYRDGTFVPTPAVLAAGTSVFVNSYGQPTVKCVSGDPLTPGSTTDPAVTTVTPASAPIATTTFRNPVTGRPVSRPASRTPPAPARLPAAREPAPPHPARRPRAGRRWSVRSTTTGRSASPTGAS